MSGKPRYGGAFLWGLSCGVMTRLHNLLLGLVLLVPGPQPGAAPLVAYAAGDIAFCGDAPARWSAAARTERLISSQAMVFVLGDTAYPFATSKELERCYRPTWGRHLDRTLAVPGNHDYVDGHSTDFVAYFGEAAGEEGRFARRLGAWLVIGLDSSDTSAGLARQYAWLETALVEHAGAACIAALWHKPLYSSGVHQGSGEQMRRFWHLLDQHGADLVLNGHEHHYEAFDPLDASGAPVAAGLRSFVVGTGGAPLRDFPNVTIKSRARISRHGVLRLELDDDSYSWQFIDVRYRRLDPGYALCRPKLGANAEISPPP